MLKLGRALFLFLIFAYGFLGPQLSAKTPEEIEAFIEAHQALISKARYVFSLTLRNFIYDEADVEELAWIALQKTAEQHDPKRGSVQSLYLTILRNKLIDYSRKKELRMRHVLPNSKDFDWTLSLRAPTDQSANAEEIRKFWAQTRDSVPYFSEFELTQVWGLPYSRVAIMLGIPEGTIKSHVHMCRRALAEIVKKLNLQKSDFLSNP